MDDDDGMTGELRPLPFAQRLQQPLAAPAVPATRKRATTAAGFDSAVLDTVEPADEVTRNAGRGRCSDAAIARLAIVSNKLRQSDRRQTPVFLLSNPLAPEGTRWRSA